MSHIDVFNGDADGVCALIQLRIAQPVADQILITGVKRDIELLSRAPIDGGDHVTVLDISLDKNRDGLERALDAGASVTYVDHHFAGEIPRHGRLAAHIDLDPNICTSLIVNRLLQGRVAPWAIVGAFGDNLAAPALELARGLGVGECEADLMNRLGIYLNYNGYGEGVVDLHFAPDELFRLTSRYAHPLDFVADGREHFQKLEDGYRQDMAAAKNAVVERLSDACAAVTLPCAAWARRVGGVFSNDLANRYPDRAHAILTAKESGGFVVSVRAPLARKRGADALCRQFPTGGGRPAAAGVNHLPEDRLAAFMDAFKAHYAVVEA